MSKEAMRGFLERLASDERLRLETGAAMAAIASRNGFDCGAAECAGMFSAAGAELSEAALEEMAGGLGVQVIGLSIGHSASQQSDGLGSVIGGSLPSPILKP